MRFGNDTTSCAFDNSPVHELLDPRIGTIVGGRYIIDEVLGEGGMAVVYSATHKVTGRPAAVKIMHTALATNPVVRERFRREAKNAQKLTHPNIIEIFDQGDTEDGTAYMTMERLYGTSLTAVIGSRAMTLQRALGIMVQLARGVARAHDLGIVHRDIKPDNIFLCPREDGSDLVKILDFGIAKSRHDSRLTGQGELFGTPQYMAPERIKSADAGPSADLYALGVVFYELLTGELPLDAPDIATFFVKHLRDVPPPPSSRNRQVPPALDALVAGMLAKEPGDRPVDGHRVQAVLLEIIESLSLPAPPSAESDAESSSAVRLSLQPAGVDQWGRRGELFEQMLRRAYGSKDHAPAPLGELLSDVHDLVRRLKQARVELLDEQRCIEDIDQRSRDRKLQLGFAVDQLGQDSSRVKEEIRAAAPGLLLAKEKVVACISRMKTLHRELIFWEGRSAFTEPSEDLALSYKRLGEATYEWLARSRELSAEKAAQEVRERNVSDVDFQLRELRAALALQEHSLEVEKEKHEARARELERTAEGLEAELLEQTTKFCMPLRKRQELGGLFKELEAEEAAP